MNGDHSWNLTVKTKIVNARIKSLEEAQERKSKALKTSNAGRPPRTPKGASKGEAQKE